MKTWFRKTVVAMAGVSAIVVSLPMAVQAQANDRCSNETLRGDWVFRLSGEVFNALGAVVAQRDGVDIVEYDGAGHFTQRDVVFANGVLVPGPSDATGFHIYEHGTYTVNPDCTGSATIMFPSPGAGISGAVIKVVFVLSNHGHTMHQIVVSLQPPGPTGEQVEVSANIHGDGEKLGSVGHIHEN